MTVSPNPDMTITANGKTVRTNLDTLKKAAASLSIRIPNDAAFYSQKFIEAPEISVIAEELIRKWPEFYELSDLDIKYVWQKKGTLKAGKAVFGKCTKVSGLAEFFGECNYVIAIAADLCRAYDFDRETMTALVYHELCHISVEEDEDTGDPILGIKGHDVEMFFDEIKRYGLWTEDLKAAKKAFEQMPLFDEKDR